MRPIVRPVREYFNCIPKLGPDSMESQSGDSTLPLCKIYLDDFRSPGRATCGPVARFAGFRHDPLMATSSCMHLASPQQEHHQTLFLFSCQFRALSLFD
jgi:hypothetical protein